MYANLLWAPLNNVTKFLNHWWFIDFNTWLHKLAATTLCDKMLSFLQKGLGYMAFEK